VTADEEETGAPSPHAVQARVLDYWERTGVPGRTLGGRADGPLFRFTEGPPTANGAPHIGHLEPRTLKDVQLRYRRMRGYRIVSSMAGWDCHGLPVELEIEKRHGLKSKKEIEAFGVERFCDECRASTLSVASVWQEMSRRLGYWLDYDHAYRTMDPPYIESVWWSLKTLFDRGLLEKGHYVLPYCPRCETPLSSHEVAQGYHDTTDPSVTVRFPLERPGGPRRDLLVWTTTPWTLPANLLVAVRADLEYSVVREEGGGELVLASGAVARYFPHGAEVVERCLGRDLVGATYRPPFDTPGPAPGRHRRRTRRTGDRRPWPRAVQSRTLRRRFLERRRPRPRGPRGP
jgi:isoleucyl-tRNA synthetase